MSRISVTAPAKINLFLHLLGRDLRGYHEIESLAAFADIGDQIIVQPSNGLTLQVEGRFADTLNDNADDNLVLRAAKLLQAFAAGQGAHITLNKELPIAAGLGGGSSDAAATLKALMKLWNIQIADADLHQLAVSLGSDVPACLAAQPCMIRGFGDAITPYRAMPKLWVVLCNPLKPLLTKDVYQAFSSDFADSCTFKNNYSSAKKFTQMLSEKSNMLELPAFTLLPELETLIDTIAQTEECLLARMSGSGATCFGLYDNEAVAKTASNVLAKRCAGHWVAVGHLQ